jgi:ATP-binding cassette subfamily B multidrug efflux pump
MSSPASGGTPSAKSRLAAPEARGPSVRPSLRVAGREARSEAGMGQRFASADTFRGVLISLLRRFLRPYRTVLLVIVVLQLVGTMASLYLPTLNADIIDNGIAKGDTGYILSTGGWMLAVSLLQIACSLVAVYFGARTAMSFGRDLRGAIFRRVNEFSAREVAHFGAPSLITRNTNDVQQVQMLVVMTCTMMIAAPIMCIGGIIMALRQDLGLSWLLGVSVPVLAVALGLIIRRMVPQFRLMQTRIDKVNGVLREQISGIRVVRAFVREPVEAKRFGAANLALTTTALRAGRLMALIFPTVFLVLNVSSVAVLWFGASRVASGAMQIGSLTAFLAYLMQILMSVMMATFMLMMVPRATVCAERIGEVLATESSVTPPAHPVSTVTLRGEVEFRAARFQYPGAAAPVLSDITLRARRGQTTAIIGSTGSGKTTLISLIPRLFDVTGGAVLVDGVDVRELAPDLLGRLIGIVPQTPYLFSGTIASNLRYGNPEATDEQLWQALEVAQARDFVEAMPDGLNAGIAQGGTNVSGGQRQRIAIARALVRQPEIYLFDDSFSALDLGTDARLRAALRPATRDAAVIIVGQRISTIADADCIVVLDAGVMVGMGTHDELLETCPTYVEIVESQLSAEDAA